MPETRIHEGKIAFARNSIDAAKQQAIALAGETEIIGISLSDGLFDIGAPSVGWLVIKVGERCPCCEQMVTKVGGNDGT